MWVLYHKKMWIKCIYYVSQVSALKYSLCLRAIKKKHHNVSGKVQAQTTFFVRRHILTPITTAEAGVGWFSNPSFHHRLRQTILGEVRGHTTLVAKNSSDFDDQVSPPILYCLCGRHQILAGKKFLLALSSLGLIIV